VKDVLSKSLGSNNPTNVVKATLGALRQLRQREAIYQSRGIELKKAAPATPIVPVPVAPAPTAAPVPAQTAAPAPVPAPAAPAPAAESGNVPA
jgi:hypothetical protein